MINMSSRLFAALLVTGQCLVTSAFAQWQHDPIPGRIGNLHSLFFTSNQVGFVIECDLVQSSWSSNLLSYTVDGGNSWQYTTGSELCPSSVFFVNNTTGYFATRGSAIGASGVRKTVNGGTTWSMADTTVGIASSFEAIALYFIDDSTGFASTSGAINKTTNGGKSWVSSFYAPASVISSIAFTSAQTGYAVGYDAPIILKTTDGGTTWDVITQLYDLLSVHFPSPDKGYAVGLHGTIVYTNDAGLTWHTPTSTDNNQQTLRSVFCLNATTCFAVGDSGTILKTTDGGVRWTKQFSGTTRRITSVVCLDNNTCFAVGDSGLVLKNLHGEETGIPALTEETNAVSLFPHPVISTVTISLATPLKGAALTIYNFCGREVRQMNNLTGSRITLDNINEPAGLYFFVIQQNNQNTLTGRFIIE